MESIINFQMSFFGPYAYIRPDSKNISLLLNRFSDDKFIPSTITTATLNTLDGSFNDEKRINMVSIDDSWGIAIMPDRIDVNFPIKANKKIDIEYDTMVNKASDLSLKMMNIFDLKTKRLAINSRCVLPKMSEKTVGAFYKKVFNPLNYYEDKKISSWVAVINGIERFKICGNDEDINVITNVSLGHSNDPNDPFRIVVAYDINTLSENTTERFDARAIKDFSEQTVAVIRGLSSNICKVMEDAKQ